MESTYILYGSRMVMEPHMHKYNVCSSTIYMLW
jgi:hypothetical protein